MKINKNSWHYRLAYDNFISRLWEPVNVFWAPKRSRDLCSYVRQILKTPINVAWMTSTLAMFILMVIGLIAFGEASALLGFADDFHFIFQLWFLANVLVAGLGMLVLAAGLVILAIAGIVWCCDTLIYQKIKARRDPDHVNIVSARYRAFKDKTCPLVEFE